MERKNLFSLIIGVVVAGSFAAGVFEPELQAQGGLPGLISNLRPGGSGHELEPVETYNKALRSVRENFVGDLPNDRELTYNAIRGMMGTLDDPYTRFLDPQEAHELKEDNSGEFEGVGALLDPEKTRDGLIRVVKPLPGGPADKAGLKRGDEISRVDGKPVENVSVDQAIKLIRGRRGTVVHLTVLRGTEKKPVEVAITRDQVEYERVTYSMKEGGIGYVSLAQFDQIADMKIEQAIRDLQSKGMKALVLDLRGNPGGLLEAAVDISSRFIPPKRDVVIIEEAGGERNVRHTNPRKYIGSPVPVAVLVNRMSASASEIVAGAIKDNHAGTLIGTTTFGKGLVQEVIPLEDGSNCIITTAKWLTPAGKGINRSREARGGVEPDIPVEVTEEQWEKREDPQLRRALDFLKQEVAAGRGNRAANAGK